MMTLTGSIDQIVRLSSDEKEAIDATYAHMELSKGDLWIWQGMKCGQVAFVLSGQLRNHYLVEAGNDVTWGSSPSS